MIDQYQVKTDKRSGIANDPNRADDPQHIVRLIGKVIGAGLKTVAIMAAPPGVGVGDVAEGDDSQLTNVVRATSNVPDLPID